MEEETVLSFLNILILLAPIFFVIALGWFAGHFGSYDAKSAKGVSTLVTKYALPAHFVSSILINSKSNFYQPDSVYDFIDYRDCWFLCHHSFGLQIFV